MYLGTCIMTDNDIRCLLLYNDLRQLLTHFEKTIMIKISVQMENIIHPMKRSDRISELCLEEIKSNVISLKNNKEPR